jgi:serine/threonine-protein kinase SRPK3
MCTKIFSDFKTAHILMKLSNFDDLTEEQVFETFGKPIRVSAQTTSDSIPGPAAPNYLVGPINPYKIDTRYLTDQICIIDLGESYESSRPPKNIGTPVAYSSPELIFDKVMGAASDIWGLGCVLSEIRSGAPLFGALHEGNDEIISAIIRLLGTLPEPWLASWEGGKFYPDPVAAKDCPEAGTPAAKLHTLKAWLSSPLCMTIASTGEEKTIAIPEDELEGFVDLLGQMFTYDPKDRISTESVKDHPWFSWKSTEDKKEGIAPQEKLEN